MIDCARFPCNRHRWFSLRRLHAARERERGWLLVNGNPHLIDVDELRLLSMESMRHDPGYASLAARYPELLLFPGERGGSRLPPAKSLPDRGKRFVIRYRCSTAVALARG
jgi:hypothetical protein